MSKRQLESDCLWAFERGKKQDAERLLPQIRQPADISTTTNCVPGVWHARLVSLLHLAAHHGWVEIVIDLITKYKCATNCKDSFGHTPLHYATINDHMEVVRYFINEQHCDPMTRDNNGNTPLHIACDYRHSHIVQYLLSTGKVDPLAKNKDGKTPMLKLEYIYGSLQLYQLGKWQHTLLHLAATHGWMDVVIDLITKYKCNTNCKDSYGRTPLHYAASNNHLKVVRYFINEQHCDPIIRDNDGDTPLHIACDHTYIHIVQYLLSTGKVDPLAKNKNGKTPMYKQDIISRLSMLHLAAAHGWMDIVIDLITKYKCDTNCKEYRGRTPLHYAVINNHLKVVRYFINEQNCDPMTEDDNGDTPLHFACSNGHFNIAQYLISEAHCNPSCENNNGNTPLHYACNHKYVHIVQYLVTTGKVDPLAKNKNGDTPLHNACNHKYVHIVQYLLSTGIVDPLARNKNGKTPMYEQDYLSRLSMLHLAAAHGWMDIIIDLITKYKCDTNCKESRGRTPLHYAVINNHLKVVRYFINEQHCDPMTEDDNGDTPLHFACSNGHFNIAQYLISEAHCNPSCENNNGNTPLHYACNHKYVHIVQYLVTTGKVDPLAKNKNGDTPLHNACNHKYVHIVEYLLSTGKVDPLARNKNGKTPMYEQDYLSRLSMLHLAASHGWMDIIIDLITKYKCDTNCKESRGRTPLHYAVISNHLEVVKYFINEQHCDPMTRNNDGDTPLHYACRYGHLNIGQYLISEAQCNPSCENKDGDTPLHYACDYRHAHIVQYFLSTGKVNPLAKNKNGKTPMLKPEYIYGSLELYRLGELQHTPLHLAVAYGWIDITIDLITKYKCDTNCKDSCGHTPLHYAAIYNHLEVVRYFINEQHCDPMTRDDDGDTPLHIVCRYGHLNIAQYLISEAHCNSSCENNNGDTPLHYACDYSHAHIVQYLVTTGKVDPLAKNKNGKTPMLKVNYMNASMFHLAAVHGWTDIIIDLITNYKCDTNCKRYRGHTPLHCAARNNHLEVVRYFINEQHCDPMARDDNGYTPLHIACIYGHLIIAQYLTREANCNPSCENNISDTPLHIACHYGNAHIVQYLLSTGKVDPLAKNKYGRTPIDYANQKDNNYDLLKLFQSFPQCERDFPVHTYTKLVLTGYSGAGKTTISLLIRLLASKPGTGLFSKLSSGRVTNVECLTAGIIPLHVESKVNEVGNMVIYDFAGQQEYYSSHAAVLESIMRNSAAIFVCIVDLSQCMDKISESIHYWISFIENTCSSAQGSSHVIIVGSHADRVKSSRELNDKSSLVESTAESRMKQLMHGGFVSMDCRLSKTKEARHFRYLLSTSQQAILSSQPSMSLYCHVLYAFLRTKLRKTGCTLQELTSALASEKDYSYKSSLLTESLASLSDKGLILFLQNQEHPLQSSWVVVEKEALLREVNGTLFAPNHFKQYRQVASNTGIVPITTLEELFPQYSSEMLVGCLESMEFCHPVDPSTLQATNLKATSSSPPSGANHLFFSSLVKEHRPGDLPSSRFGWCLGCSDPHQFFSNRFLHVLLLRLAFTFPLASKKRSLSPSLRGLERQCEVWQNGICWKSCVSGVSTIVEIVDLNRWVIVLVSEKTREAAETCSSVIRMILDLQHQLCSAVVTTCECLISPSLLDRYPFDFLPDTDLFDIPMVARSMLLHHKLLLDRNEGKNEFSTDEALSCEPYYLLQPSSVCQLFNQSMASQPVPDPLLQEVLRYCQQPHQKPRDCKELRECVNKHSIFAGRNPLVSSVHVITRVHY